MKYAELDKRIIKGIAEGCSPLYNKHINEEAKRIGEDTDRLAFRVIDGRLQELRKSGKIIYLKKSENNGKNGWYVTGNVEVGT